MHLVIRYDPVSGNEEYAEFSERLLFQFFLFVGLIGTFLEFKTYSIPVTIIYSGIFWTVYVLSPQCEILFFTALYKFSIAVVLNIGTAFMVHRALSEAFFCKSTVPL